jgi:eukaryotic-like serine/threonine-protein kinase
MSTSESALAAGQQIGPYTIRSPLGSGGMGEVYRARDATLGREVAIKVLPSLFTSDPERLARFEREARLLASLNHPNIATIHGVEHADGLHALVLELVEGETLGERLESTSSGLPDNRAGLPLAEALAIARQIADALEAAHEKGVVHRDLKPANIKIRPDGVVKVLDFGLAKAVAAADSADVSQLPTQTMGGTQDGVILGTPIYMSPEQARGQVVDARADIWAFGCVLYEMLTGSRVFAGNTSGELLAEILKTEPDWDRLPAHTPENIRRLLDRCLRKERSRRLKDIADARLEIDDVSVSVRPPDRAGLKRGERAMWAAAIAMLLVVILVIVAWSRPPEELERRFEINTPSRASAFALSPDGLTVTFAAFSDGPSRLWVRPLNALTANALAGTEGARQPFWSPDGQSIGFFTDRELKRVSLNDGSVQSITAAVPASVGASWNRENTILYSASPGAPIRRISVMGDEPVDATRFEAGQRGHFSPHFLPDQRHFLFFVTGPPDTRGIHLAQLGDQSSRRLADADGPAVFMQGSGHLLFVRAGKLLAQAFDADRLELNGNPLVIDEHVTDGTVVTASATGLFAYHKPPPDSGQRQLTWVNRKGQELQKVVYADTMGLGPALSHDGRRVAVFRLTNSNVDIWAYAVERRTWDRLTVHAGDDIYPLWSRDDSEIVFGSRRGSMDLYRKRVNSAPGSEELLLSTPQVKFPTDWSRDGRFLLYNAVGPKGNVDIWALPLDGARTPIAILGTAFNEQHAQFSPDSQWIAYQSDKTGRSEIYVRPFAGSGADVPVSTGGGSQVRWSPNGFELFYIAADDRLMTVPIRTTRTDSPVELGAPQTLFQTNVGTTAPNTNRHQFAVSPDGESFVLNSVPEPSATSPLTVVVNWKPRP